MSTAPITEPASVVDARYPHTGVVHPLGPNGTGWWEHKLPNDRIAVVAWLYESEDAKRRTVIVFEWNNPDSEWFIEHNVYHAVQASHVTNKFMDELAKLPNA